LKLFNLLIDRQLPLIILRFLLQMYTDFKACIFRNGLYSNDVNQGEILSPVLFCVNFDVLINTITQSGYGCYIGPVFLAVSVYAADVVLLAPKATATRHLLSSCDMFATDLLVIFNAHKSKYIFFDSAVSHPSCLLTTFYVLKNVIEIVDTWPHLRHIHSNNVKCNNDDIGRCYWSLVKQINELLCYFGNLNVSTELKLLYSFCSSLYTIAHVYK